MRCRCRMSCIKTRPNERPINRGHPRGSLDLDWCRLSPAASRLHSLDKRHVWPGLRAAGNFFLWAGSIRNQLEFRYQPNLAGILGAALLVVAILTHPLIAWLDGHPSSTIPLCGTAPASTTIFTCGMLLQTVHRPPRYLLAIPLAWALIAGAAAWELGITEDTILMPAAIVAIAVILFKARQSRAPISRSNAE